MGWPGRGTYALHTAAKAVSMLWREITNLPFAVLRGAIRGWSEGSPSTSSRAAAAYHVNANIGEGVGVEVAS